jgi:hypothetical protein
MYYARRTRTRSAPEAFDQAVKVVEEQVIPNAGKMPGFMGGYWLADRSTGEAMSFTFFDSQEALEASRMSADQVRNQATQSIGAEVVSVEHMVVAVNTGDKVHSTASHARVIEFGGDPAQRDAAMQRIKEQVIPSLRELDGFMGGFWALDPETGKGVGVTLFDSEKSLLDSTERANQLRSQSAQISGAQIGEPKNFEIYARAETAAKV